jgi:hypothetical protein
MIQRDLSAIDFSQYNRLFVFGCSFTHWFWPTWADIIAYEHPHLEFHNLGNGGSGNLHHAAVFSQMDLAHNFCKTDLIMFMWSSFHRNDHYTVFGDKKEFSAGMMGEISDNLPKNTQVNWRSGSDHIACEFLENRCYPDNRGFMIRDCALIHNIIQICAPAEYTAVHMMAIGLDEQPLYDGSLQELSTQDIQDLYKDIFASNMVHGKSMGSFVGIEFEDKSKFISEEDGTLHGDHHPLTGDYLQYMEYLGLSFNERTRSWCRTSDQVMATNTRRYPIIPKWKYKTFRIPL